MQILINLSDAQVEAILDQAKQRGLTSSDVISEALSKNLGIAEEEKALDISQYAGLWVRDGEAQVDALEYQDKLRAEWER